MIRSRTEKALGAFLSLPDFVAQLDVRHPGPARYWIRRIRAAVGPNGDPRPDPGDLGVFEDLTAFEMEPGESKFGDDRAFYFSDWWRLSPDSFLMLERHPRGGRAEVVGVSIVLPVTDAAVHLMINGRRSVPGLTDGDLLRTQDPTPNLLIAGWVIAPRWRNKLGGFAQALVVRHLGLFWDPSVPEQGRVRLLFVPSHRSLRAMLQEDLCCLGPFPLRDFPPGRELMILPLPVGLGTDDLKRTLDKFTRNVAGTRAWPL